ncbi:TetR/AcrR family transcriptional regulator [Actibacterium sp. XHP0104]|uniref:acrylate utilization transcriptional regulator AcuR n=1 Tax=Actibacterium sp. XHP0104 TaxID=2984335 RepID=UPI0021E839A3|nr:TetR/AcrR family transcriptional regulator [Actibacterium sp. XHP0104]MCV2881881.1 TetR/AcrR family transcriptional regulator [Actibacterium sp. XHP0104]
MTENRPPKRGRGRPPKDEAQHRATMERLVNAGLAVLTEKGFSAVGIDEILRLAEVPKGSFYHYFDSKTAFGSELIDRYSEYFVIMLTRWFTDDSLTPLNRMRAFVAEAMHGMARYQYRRGCLVGNLGQEMGTLPEVLRGQLTGVFDTWQALTADCLRAAQDTGEIAPHHDCDRLAALFWIGWEGAVLRAKLERQPEPLEIFAEGFFAMIGARQDRNPSS